jgi:lycopene beta-cyclase
LSARYDLILVGAGLANGLIALRLHALRSELKLLVLEAGPAPGGNHTWSFHDADLRAEQRDWLEPLISHRWDGYAVIFPARVRDLHGGYASIASADFAHVLTERLGGAIRCNTAVAEVTPTRVRLHSGETLEAGAVIDGRGALGNPHMALGYQAFLGQEVRLTRPHGLDRPILMDASVAQEDGYRFVYVLPFSTHTLLIEDTHYVDGSQLDVDRLREHIGEYASTRDWNIVEVLREERGVLPITLAGDIESFWREANGQPRAGLRAGLFHPTTGYSLPHAVRLAERIAAQPDLSAPALFALIHAESTDAWQRQGFFRLLNRMLFLAGAPRERWRVMQRFYGLPEGLIQRFYAGRPTLADKLRIVSGKPPVPLLPAWHAARAGDLHLRAAR